MKRSLLSIAMLMATSTSVLADSYVRYNQAGYFPSRDKVAIVMADESLSGKAWTIQKDGQTVLSATFGQPTHGTGPYTAQSFNYEIDFSELKQTGDYTIVVPASPPETVSIKSNPYGFLANEMLRFLRQQRSGTTDTVDRDIGHAGDANSPIYRPLGDIKDGKWEVDASGKTADVQGGWSDAGDYIKFTLIAASTTHVLLQAYENDPSLFTKEYSTTTLVDILDEAKVGLDYLSKLYDPINDEFIVQVSTGLDHEEKWRLPKDDLRDGKREALSALSPSHMFATAGTLAYGAKIFRSVNEMGLAGQYEAKAKEIYSRALQSDVLKGNTYEKDRKNDFYFDGQAEVIDADGNIETYVSSIDDMRTIAATQLYALTQDPQYFTQAKEASEAAGFAYWFSWSSTHMMGNQALRAFDSAAGHRVRHDLDAHNINIKEEGNIWGAAQPWDWGTLANNLYVAGAAGQEVTEYGDKHYQDILLDNFDYLLGRNNWGTSFVYSPNLSNNYEQIHHQLYTLKPELPPIGAVIGGPGNSKYMTDPDIIKPDPCYTCKFNAPNATFFDHATNYVTSEPTIFGQAAALFALSSMSKLEKNGVALDAPGVVKAKKSPPGGLDPKQVPLFIAMGSDDNSTIAGVDWLTNTTTAITNPAGVGNAATYDGTRSSMTFFHTGAYAGKIGGAWKRAHDLGIESANHTQTHTTSSQSSAADWASELSQAAQNISSTGIPRSMLKGFRAPYLQYNDALFTVMKEQGYYYDSSLQEGWSYGQDGTNYNWPYTLDDKSPAVTVSRAYQFPNAPEIVAYPGIWELPLYPVIVPPNDKDGFPYDLRAKIKKNLSYFSTENGKITGFDYNLINNAKMSKEEILTTLKYTFDLRLKGNRAPILLGSHAKGFNSDNSPMAWAYKRFLDYAVKHPDVRIVSYDQVIQWMKNPRALDDAPLSITASVKKHLVAGNCTDPVWDASVIYLKDEKVSYQGHTWNSGWHNAGNEPGKAQWGPWSDLGKCNGVVAYTYGSMTPEGIVLVDEGGQQTFTFTPDAGYVVKSLKVNNALVTPTPQFSYSFSNVNEAQQIEVEFGTEQPVDTYDLSVTGGLGGTITPNGVVTVPKGADQTFAIDADSGYVVKSFTVNGVAVQPAPQKSYTVTNVTANLTVDVTFKSVPTFEVTINAGAGGTISPSGVVAVEKGKDFTVTLTPDSGYKIDTLTVDGTTVVLVNSSYTLPNVQGAKELVASFIKDPVVGCQGIPVWNTDTVFVGGTDVQWNGIQYESRYWNQRNEPGTQNPDWGPWITIKACK